jgi:outer membrane receptor protein involved in Fe transport
MATDCFRSAANPATDNSQAKGQTMTRYWTVAACISITLSAQSIDTGVLGTVVDPAGGAVTLAAVTITNRQTGVARKTVTDSAGSFDVRYLIPGEYVVETQAPGFRAERRTGIQIQLGQQARLEFKLQVGEVQQTVEVNAAAPLLQTENATLGEVIGTERITNLPLNGRSFTQLAALTPGVRTVDPSLYTASTDGSRIIANGARDIWMQVNLDGVTMVNNRSNYVNLYPSIDALQEFKVQSGNYSAEYGGNGGANINLQLRSGTNQLHGTVFEFLRNDRLDARGYFRPQPLPKDVLKRNQFGTVVSGPIRRDKTFFMLGYEAIRSERESPGSNIVLTAAQRAGDFSSSSAAIIDPLSGLPFPGNTIPRNRLNPVSVSLINQYMPLPNTPGTVNYNGVVRGTLKTDQGLARIDQYLGAKDQIFAHYIYSRRDFPNVDLNPNFRYDGTFPNSSFSVQHVRTFTPSLLNEARFGWNRANVSKLSPRTNSDFTIESLGINGLRIGGPSGRPLRRDEQGFPVMNITGFLGLGDSQASSNLDNSRTYQFVDNVSWIHRSHALKFGTDIRRLLDDATTNNWPFAQMTFSGDLSGSGAADFMLGYPRTTLTPEGVPISSVRQWRYAFYLQDDWKATPRLTLNLGFRYDLYGQPHEINGVTRTLRFDLDPSGPVLWPQLGEVVDVWKNEFRNLGPRFGLAYRLPYRMVLRGGYGIFFTAAQFDNINILQLNPPVGGSLTVINPIRNPVATIQNPVPAELYPQNPIFNVVSIPPDRKRRNAYLQNWNLQMSRELGSNSVVEIGWVGSKGTHVDTSLNNFNQPNPGDGPIQQRRPYPQYARIRMIAPDTNTIYHSLQARFEHRFHAGLSLTSAYTWSHMIDDAGQTINRGGCVCQNPRNRGRAERGDSIQDQRHRLVAGYVWELPFTRNLKGVAGVALGGWSTGGILTLASGFPFNVTQSGDTQNNDALWPRPHLVSGVKAELDNPDPSQWFNTAAFARSVLEYGTAPRNPLVGPGTSTLDFSASKNFRMPFSDRHGLLFRAEFFNFFNTPQFANPGSTLGTGTFGRATSTALDNRQIQFALKYSF